MLQCLLIGRAGTLAAPDMIDELAFVVHSFKSATKAKGISAYFCLGSSYERLIVFMLTILL